MSLPHHVLEATVGGPDPVYASFHRHTMTQRAKIPPRSWLAIVGRATPAFTPAYAPAPPTFWGQLWAALTRSTPAFTGAWLPDVTDAPADSALPLLDTAFAEVVLPTFLSSDRAQSFARENGHVLALCLARQRELGLRIAQQMTLDNIYYFTKELKLYRAMGLQHIFAGYLRAVAQALSLALTLNRLIAHDLTNGQAQHRAYARRRNSLAPGAGSVIGSCCSTTLTGVSIEPR